MAEARRHETRDLSARVPLFAVVVTLLSVPVTAVLVWWLMDTVWAPPPVPASPFAVDERPEPPKVPRLQTDPGRDLEALNRRMEKRLHSLEWVDRDAGIVRLPIERAMEVIAERGLQESDPQ